MGGVNKTHEARTVRLPRSTTDEPGGYLARRPRDPDTLVFTWPLGAALRWSNGGKAFFKPALRATGLPAPVPSVRPRPGRSVSIV